MPTDRMKMQITCSVFDESWSEHHRMNSGCLRLLDKTSCSRSTLHQVLPRLTNLAMLVWILDFFGVFSFEGMDSFVSYARISVDCLIDGFHRYIESYPYQDRVTIKHFFLKYPHRLVVTCVQF